MRFAAMKDPGSSGGDEREKKDERFGSMVSIKASIEVLAAEADRLRILMKETQNELEKNPGGSWWRRFAGGGHGRKKTDERLIKVLADETDRLTRLIKEARNDSLGKILEVFDTMEARLESLESSMRFLNEQDIRRAVKAEYGELYAQQHTVDSITSLLAMLPDAPGIVPRSDLFKDVDLATNICVDLLNRKVHERFFEDLSKALKQPNTGVFFKNMKELLGANHSLLLEQIEDYLLRKNEPIYLQAKCLAECEGLGLLLAIYDVDKTLVFSKDKLDFSCWQVIEYDIRGRIDVQTVQEDPARCYIRIETGQCEPSYTDDFSVVTTELGVRLKLLHWAVAKGLMIRKVQVAEVATEGRVFIVESGFSREEKETVREAFKLAEELASNMGFSLRLKRCEKSQEPV